MNNASVTPTAPVLPAVTSAGSGSARQHNPRQRPRPRRRAEYRLLETVLPGKDAELYEVAMEFEGGAFAGVTIRDRATGREILFLDADELRDRQESPGLLLERQG